MTTEEFLVEFAKVAKNADWIIENGREEIRTTDGYCPICFLAREKGLNYEELKIDYSSFIGPLNLWHLNAHTIAIAADTRTGRDDSYEVRKKLIEITGVK